MRNIFGITNENGYNPRDMKPHKGMTYSTEKGSDYSLDYQGCFHGRPSMEWAQPELIAGLSTDYTQDIIECLDKQNRRQLRRLVLKHGEKPTGGKYLVVVLSKKDAKLRKTIGLKSSPLEARI